MNLKTRINNFAKAVTIMIIFTLFSMLLIKHYRWYFTIPFLFKFHSLFCIYFLFIKSKKSLVNYINHIIFPFSRALLVYYSHLYFKSTLWLLFGFISYLFFFYITVKYLFLFFKTQKRIYENEFSIFSIFWGTYSTGQSNRPK